MGLDIVELVMDIEDEFGISIPAERMQKINTVGELVALVRELCSNAAQRGGWDDFAVFRSAVSKTTGRSEDGVKPETALEELFPWRGRSQRWEKVRDAMRREGVQLPPLERPRGCLAGTLAIGAFCLLCVLIVSSGFGLAFWIATLIVLVLVALAVMYVYSPYHPSFPRRATTVRALFALPTETVDVERRIIELTAKKADEPPDRIKTEMRLLDIFKYG